MKTPIGQTGVNQEDLELYFDGELTGAEAQELAAQIEAQPELAAELDKLGSLRGVVSAALMHKADEVPQARFEQLWDEIDRSLDQEESRQRVAASEAPSFWSRLRGVLGPLRVPAMVAAAAVAVTVVVMRTGGDASTPNNPPAVASEQGQREVSTPMPAADQPQPSGSKMAQAPEAPPEAESKVFEAPEPGQADIESIQFGGKNGRIGRAGTVTVLYVEEDDESIETERSL